MAHVYVIGATLPAGGAFMAYQLGCILNLHFGYELVNVEVNRNNPKVFEYHVPMRTISLQDMQRAITDDDILIANPSFSNFLFGARLPSRKIMYAQGFTTYTAMDGHFDLYVSASSTVQRYLSAVWGIESTIIAPFIQVDMKAPVTPWRDRPKGSALVFMKQAVPENMMIHEYLKDRLARRDEAIDISQVLEGRNLPQAEFFKRIGEVRYLINLTLAEGFGLVPLEAMASGTMVTGLDGLAGRDYMRYRENCLVGSFKELTALPDIIYRAMTDDALAEACVAEGRKTAALYGYGSFERAWVKKLSDFLGVKPSYGNA